MSFFSCHTVCMKNVKMILLVSVVLSGCASATYKKDGSTKQEFYSAKSDCSLQAKADRALSANDGGIFKGVLLNRAFDECMMGKGFNKE